MNKIRVLMTLEFLQDTRDSNKKHLEAILKGARPETPAVSRIAITQMTMAMEIDDIQYMQMTISNTT